jgi:hypothetical protein
MRNIEIEKLSAFLLTVVLSGFLLHNCFAAKEKPQQITTINIVPVEKRPSSQKEVLQSVMPSATICEDKCFYKIDDR